MKFIEAPDFHLDPRWVDVSISCGKAVAEAAREHKVDFIAAPGDFFNRPLYASEKGGINVARKIFASWLKICPVVAIEGTPSHDAPGAYGFLEDLGVKLLKPYEYHIIGNTIIFGIPELSTENIHAQLNIGSLEANALAELGLSQYVAEYLGPTRAAHPDKIAVGMLHGNVTDSHRDNLRDIILKASDILIRTEYLRPAMLDRWSLGHIHTPWESSEISAGYAGFTGVDDNPYGKTGFKPAMNLIEITVPNIVPKITRLPYGTPERRKIKKPLAKYEDEIAYWLETDDDDAVDPKLVGGHAWSRKTTVPKDKIKPVSEITEEASIVDMFKAWDKDAPISALEKVATMEQTFKAQAIEAINVEVGDVEINGGIFWGSRYIKINLKSLSRITALRGDNGEGKSSVLAFCTPYPVVVGKDTESGRDSAIKEFFDQPDSWLKKTVYRNGVEHIHKITIKAAHTKSAKTECFLYINGVNQLETTSFDEMFAKCEALYGPFADYLITSFYIQPDQSQQRSGLMSSKRIDARNIVQAITGVDRSREARHALDNKASFEKQVEAKNNFISGLEVGLLDQEVLKANLSSTEITVLSYEKTLEEVTAQGKIAAAALATAQEAATKADLEAKRQAEDSSLLKAKQDEILAYEAARLKLEANRKALAEIEVYKAATLKNRELKIAYDAQVQAWNLESGTARQAIDDKNRKLKQGYEDAVRAYNNIKAELTLKINQASAVTIDSCPNCGYVDPNAQGLYEAAQNNAELNQAELDGLVAPPQPVYFSYPADKPEPAQPVYLAADVPFADEVATRQEIQTGEAAAAKIDSLTSQIKELEAKTYNLDEDALFRAQEAQAHYSALQGEYRQAVSDLSQAKAQVTIAKEAIDRSARQAEEIVKAKAELKIIQDDLSDWAYIAKGLQSGNIPALELERNLEAIDREATRILSPFMEGQFSLRTEAAEGFDILVHDSETGLETSFFKRNPGHKAFFSDAYTKSLIKRRNEQQHRSYSPIIMDEADAPIQEARIGMYYEMQDRYFGQTDARVLVVSQKDPAYIQNSVYIKDLVR